MLMFLWTMVLPFNAIEKETQAKPRVPAPPVVAQGAAVPTVSSPAR
jgi:hypothetical protein